MKGVNGLTTQSYDTPKIGHSFTEKRNVRAAVLNEFLPEIVYRRIGLEVLSLKSFREVKSSKFFGFCMEYTPNRQGGGNSSGKKLKNTVSFRLPKMISSFGVPRGSDTNLGKTDTVTSKQLLLCNYAENRGQLQALVLQGLSDNAERNLLVIH